MKICKLIIHNFQQFKNTVLDFTNPYTNTATDKICFIGRNGTGKSTLLRILDNLIVGLASIIDTNGDPENIPSILRKQDSLIIVKILLDGEIIYALINQHRKSCAFLMKAEIDTKLPDWIDKVIQHKNDSNLHENTLFREFIFGPEEHDKIINKLRIKDNAKDLIISSPSGISDSNAGLPNTNLNSALELFKKFPSHHIVSNGTVSEMWRQLVFLVKKRESDREEFENRTENLNRTKKVLINEFNRTYPDPLEKIAMLWNKILAHAGLELDTVNAKKPIQLTDNLKAYIKLKSTNEIILYNQLSTGIHDFIFRLGHIFLLFFQRDIERGFVLIDEPENSLFPDFLFDLIDIYTEVLGDKDNISRTQMFFATHNPIVAAQFHPYERIVLELDDLGYVKAKKGRAPIGDDPNDLLSKDFELTRLMGKEGEKKWDEYLQKQIL